MRLLLTCAVLVGIGSVVYGSETEALFSDYVTAMIDGDFAKAEGFWHPDYIEGCNRFGIDYRGLEYKFDCASPLSENLDLLRSGDAAWEVVTTRLNPQNEKAILTISGAGKTITHEYFFLTDSSGTKLIPRFWMHLNNLKLIKTKYFDVYYRNDQLVNDYAIAELDQSIDRYAARTNVPLERLSLIEKERMEYFLAETENEVAELLGFQSQGSYLPTCDVIITKYLPDYHEIARFMTSLTQDVGLYTEPFMSQGIACMLGGRFGQAKEVMPQIAEFTLANDLYELEDVLTFDGFHNTIGNIDFSFPLSLCLVEYMKQEFKINTVFEVLTRLSGDIDAVNRWTVDSVKAVLTDVTGSSWESIEAGTRQWAMDNAFNRLKPGISSDSGKVVFESGTPNYRIKIRHSDGWYNVVISEYNTNVPVEGTVVLLGSLGVRFKDYWSFLFREHFPDRGHTSEVYSIRFNESEVGIYDYLTNRLLAKYVTAFDTGPGMVEDREVRFRFADDILLDLFENYMSRLWTAGNEYQ